VVGFTKSLAPLDKEFKIRVVALAPGAFLSGIWSKDRIDWMNDEAWVPIEKVVDTAINCVVGNEVNGGEVFRILPNGTHVDPVGPEYGSDPLNGPTGEGARKGLEEVFLHLRENS
jgi:hypothetical protein